MVGTPPEDARVSRLEGQCMEAHQIYLWRESARAGVGPGHADTWEAHAIHAVAHARRVRGAWWSATWLPGQRHMVDMWQCHISKWGPLRCHISKWGPLRCHINMPCQQSTSHVSHSTTTWRKSQQPSRQFVPVGSWRFRPVLPGLGHFGPIWSSLGPIQSGSGCLEQFRARFKVVQGYSSQFGMVWAI